MLGLGRDKFAVLYSILLEVGAYLKDESLRNFFSLGVIPKGSKMTKVKSHK